MNERNREELDEVSNKRLTSMAYDIAKGLEYLAEQKYVHRDIACRLAIALLVSSHIFNTKFCLHFAISPFRSFINHIVSNNFFAPRNCLVNSSRTVKLADFGMTRPMFESDYYRFSKKGNCFYIRHP